MKHIYRYWREGVTGKEGYSVADITFNADACPEGSDDTCWYSKDRKTLNATINDAKRHFKKHPDHYICIYAHAVLTDYYNDGTKRYQWEDGLLIGNIEENGEYGTWYQDPDWLEKA